MIKKIIDLSLNLTLVILIGFASVFIFFQGVKPVLESNSFTYKTLPEPYKNMIAEFIYEAQIRNLDIRDIYKTKFFLVHDEKLHWGGYSNSTTNSIFLNTATDIEAVKFVLWHELGHGILNYGHDLRPITSHIMNSGFSQHVYISWEQRKVQFFNEPMPRNYIKNSIAALYKNNYLFIFIKEKTSELYSKSIQLVQN